MFRFNRLVCVLVGCMMCSVSFGKAVKIKVFTPVLTGETANPDVDGMAVFNYRDPEGNSTAMTHIAFTVSDLLPDTEYSVQFRGTMGGATTRFTTNLAGVGHVNTHTNSDITTHYLGGPENIHVYVFIDTDEDFTVNPSEIRAVGCVTGNCELPAHMTACTEDSDCALPTFPCIDTACELNYCSAVGRICPSDDDICTWDICNGTTGECEYTPIYDPANGCNPF